MESEVGANNSVLKGKRPTRLQKQAPATLQLHEISSNQPRDFSKSVIPLLSPLVLSPAPLPEASDRTEAKVMKHEMAIGKISQVQQGSGGSCGRGSGWQHPAMEGTITDTSCLYTCFHSQCTLLPRNQ